MEHRIFLEPTLGTNKPVGNLMDSPLCVPSEHRWHDWRLIECKGLIEIQENRNRRGLTLTKKGAAYVLGRGNSYEKLPNDLIREAKRKTEGHFAAIFEGELVNLSQLKAYMELGIHRFLIVDCRGSFFLRDATNVSLIVKRGKFQRIAVPNAGRIHIQGCKVRRLDILFSEAQKHAVIMRTDIDHLRVHSAGFRVQDISVREILFWDPEFTDFRPQNIAITYADPRKLLSRRISPERIKRALATQKYLTQRISLEANQGAIQQFYQFFDSRNHPVKTLLFTFNRAHHAIVIPLIFFVMLLLINWFILGLYTSWFTPPPNLSPNGFLPPGSYILNVPRLFTDVLLAESPIKAWDTWQWIRNGLRIAIGLLEAAVVYSLFSLLSGLKKRFGYKKFQ